MVVAIIALIAAMSASMGSSMIESARRVNTSNKLDGIEAALLAFRLANNRIPCPTDPAIADIPANSATYGYETGAAGTCGGGSTTTYTVPSPGTGSVVEGAVPVKALNLPDDFQLDGWGRKFAYAVWSPMTAAGTSSSPAAFLNYGISPSCGAIIVENAGHGNRTTSGIYALLSYGPDGHGGYTKGATTRYNVGASMANIDEIANAHYDGSGADTGYLATYIEKEYGQYPSDNDPLHPFGDYVRFKERWQMQDDYDRYQPYGAAKGSGNPTNVPFDFISQNQFAPGANRFFAFKETCGSYHVLSPAPAPFGSNPIRLGWGTPTAISPDDTYVAIAGGGNSVYIYKLNAGGTGYDYLTTAVNAVAGWSPTQLQFSPDGNYLLENWSTSTTLFQRSGDVFTELTAGFMPVTDAGANYSATGNFIFVQSDVTNDSSIYGAHQNDRL